MENLSLVFFLLIITTALISAGYNWMYKKEIHRMEKQVGVIIPSTLIQLLSGITLASLLIAVVGTILFFISSLL